MNPNSDLSALKQVMGQSGMGTGVLDQAVGGAPTANAANVPPSVQPGQALPQGQAGAPSAQGGVQPSAGLPVGSPEAQTIIEALNTNAKILGKRLLKA